MAKPKYAGFWIRFVAVILDSIIIGIPAAIIQTVLVMASGVMAMQYVVQLLAAALVIYLNGIHGATPGKMILGMRIVNAKGKYIGIPHAILRYIGKFVSAIIFGIGFLMIIWDKKKQGLHDKIASSFVVYK